MKTSQYFTIIIVLLFSLFTACNKNEQAGHTEEHADHAKTVTLSAAAIKDIQLETETITRKPITGYLALPAKVITNQDNEAQIGSLVQGRVHQVFVNVGDYVKAGQIVMTVEGLDVGQIKAGFMKSKASYEFAKANYERQKKLFEEKVGSQKTLLESKAEFERTMAEFKAEDKKIHSVGLSDEDITSARANEEHTSGTLPIKAPISGIVVERNVVIGQLVDATTNAFRVINTSSVWVDGQMYEKDMAKISQKTSAVFVSPAYPNERFQGSVSYIGQTVDEHSRTITIRCVLNNPANRLKSQMFGELQLPLGGGAKGITIPEEALIQEAGISYVFVQTGDTVFEQRIVTPGSIVDRHIEIQQGLEDGEKLVVKGVFYLKSELKKDEIAGDEH